MTQEKHKPCFKCGETKPLSAFYKHPMMADGHLNKCKECNKRDVILNRLDKVEYYNEYDRNRSYPGAARTVASNNSHKLKYKENLEYRKVSLEQRSKWNARNATKKKAQSAVTREINSGHLVRPDTCSSCGKTYCEIQGHHWSYLEEHWLDVIWLCTECHGKEHRKINAEARKAKALEQQKGTHIELQS